MVHSMLYSTVTSVRERKVRINTDTIQSVPEDSQEQPLHPDKDTVVNNGHSAASLEDLVETKKEALVLKTM